jgi:hypothetical protein
MPPPPLPRRECGPLNRTKQLCRGGPRLPHYPRCCSELRAWPIPRGLPGEDTTPPTWAGQRRRRNHCIKIQSTRGAFECYQHGWELHITWAVLLLLLLSHYHTVFSGIGVDCCVVRSRGCRGHLSHGASAASPTARVWRRWTEGTMGSVTGDGQRDGSTMARDGLRRGCVEKRVEDGTALRQWTARWLLDGEGWIASGGCRKKGGGRHAATAMDSATATQRRGTAWLYRMDGASANR